MPPIMSRRLLSCPIDFGLATGKSRLPFFSGILIMEPTSLSQFEKNTKKFEKKIQSTFSNCSSYVNAYRCLCQSEYA